MRPWLASLAYLTTSPTIRECRPIQWVRALLPILFFATPHPRTLFDFLCGWPAVRCLTVWKCDTELDGWVPSLLNESRIWARGRGQPDPRGHWDCERETAPMAVPSGCPRDLSGKGLSRRSAEHTFTSGTPRPASRSATRRGLGSGAAPPATSGWKVRPINLCTSELKGRGWVVRQQICLWKRRKPLTNRRLQFLWNRAAPAL